MTRNQRDQITILQKLGIDGLNPMQEAAGEAIATYPEVILLSPTGTGKTMAFLLPIIAALDPNALSLQVLILVPSRELALQIEQVIREMGSGFKVNAVYGGRAGAKDMIELRHPPALLVGTPGRIADHFRRGTLSPQSIHTLVLDEFDKSLEVGFEGEMKEIVQALPALQKKVLTSATRSVGIPDFVGIKDAKEINYLTTVESTLHLKTIITPTKDKLATLVAVLLGEGQAQGIIFCNLKETVGIVSDFLERQGLRHSCFHGGLEQRDREHALIKFRNGTHRLLLATDLAARGIDVPQLDFILHYQLPLKQEEFVHRNGRTARMHQEGTAYILKRENEELPDFALGAETVAVSSLPFINTSETWETLSLSGGRKDKISKGDIAGLFFKQGRLQKGELGMIELKNDCAFVAVPQLKAEQLIAQLNNSRLKKKKVRIKLLG